MTIPEDIVQKLSKLPIEEVAERLGISVKRHNAICFMHNDHSPSLKFSSRKNIFFCFVCNKGGGPIQLVQEHEGWTFQEACVWLGDKFKIWCPQDKPYIPKRKVRPASKATTKVFVYDKKVIDAELGEWLIEHSDLSESACRFLFEERKYKPEVVAQLKVKSLLNQNDLAIKAEMVFGRDRCINSGLFWTGGKLRLCFDAPCLLFPFYSIDGILYSVQSRYLGKDQGVNRFRFPKDIKQGIFNAPILNTISPKERLYISEGVTDCIALLSSGKKAVAFPGSGIHHEEDVLLLANKNLYMYPDNDDAGTRLYDKINEILKPYSNIVRKLTLKVGCKDYSDMYLQDLI